MGISDTNTKATISAADVNDEAEMECDTHSEINLKETNTTENGILQTSLAEPVEKLSKVIVEELPQIEVVAATKETQYCPVSIATSPSSKKLLHNRLTIDDYVLVT